MKCDTPGATVWVDGKEVGPANEPTEVPWGKHVVEVRAAGFHKRGQNVTFRTKQMTLPIRPLDPAPAKEPPTAPPAPN